MSAESAFYRRFKDKIKKVPDRLKPDKESIEKMGNQISSYFDQNDAMRANSYINAEKTMCE